MRAIRLPRELWQRAHGFHVEKETSGVAGLRYCNYMEDPKVRPSGFGEPAWIMR